VTGNVSRAEYGGTVQLAGSKQQRQVLHECFARGKDNHDSNRSMWHVRVAPASTIRQASSDGNRPPSTSRLRRLAQPPWPATGQAERAAPRRRHASRLLRAAAAGGGSGLLEVPTILWFAVASPVAVSSCRSCK
jgi:hypothetical protein